MCLKREEIMIYNRKWFNPQLAFKKLPDVATFPNGKIRLQSSLLPNLTQTIILLYYNTLGLSFFEMDEVKKQEWFPRRVWKYLVILFIQFKVNYQYTTCDTALWQMNNFFGFSQCFLVIQKCRTLCPQTHSKAPHYQGLEGKKSKVINSFILCRLKQSFV